MVGQVYSPAGYAWIFPLGKNLVRIGVGVGKPESEVDPTQRLDELIEKGVGPIKDLGKDNKERISLWVDSKRGTFAQDSL